MAKLRHIFLSGLETIFKTFEEAVKNGIYYLEDENEFTSTTPSSCSVRCIFEQFKEKDVSLLSFSDLIQPNDIFGIIPFTDMTLAMKSTGSYITFTTEGTYAVVGYDKDPLNVMFTVLLRKN